MHLLNEISQHLFADLKVCNHTVFERAYCFDVVGRSTHHFLRLDANRNRPPIVHIDRHDRRLVEHHTETTGINQGVCSPEVDGEVTS